MLYDQTTAQRLYKKLLALYPPAFRERLGESMEQTFNDLCNERKQQTGRGWFGFLLGVFAETALGIFRERVLLITKGDPMKSFLVNLRSPAIIGAILVLPFMILELINRRNFHEGFPVPLFGMLWLLPVIFIVLLMPIVQNVRAGNNLLAQPVGLLLRVVFLVLIAWLWGSLLMDQMPCFLGVPNCD